MNGVTIAGDPVPEAMIPVLQPERHAWKRKLKLHEIDELKNVMLAAYERLDLRIQQHVADSGNPVACQKGCSWCCRGVKVEVHAPEALVIAERIRSDQRLRSALEAAASKRRTMKTDALAASRAACPFLDHDQCAIYDIRPMMCRNHCCTDAAGCKRAFEHPALNVSLSLHMPAVAAASISVLGMRWACDDLGLDNRTFELTNAVAVALQQDSASKWFEGGRIFDEAVRPVDVEAASIAVPGPRELPLQERRPARLAWKSHSRKRRKE
jgi:Fe-S-cluster containining protein